MPRYKVTLVDDVALIEFEGTVMTRRFWWLGAVDALLLQGRRTFVVSLEKATLQTFADARFVSAIAERVLRHDGRVVFVVPPGRRAAARVRAIARHDHVLAAPTVESALEAAGRKEPPRR
jgi:hypothetical protein